MAHGGTQEAALARANEAIQLSIDTAREFGDTIPEPKGERLMLARGVAVIKRFAAGSHGQSVL